MGEETNGRYKKILFLQVSRKILCLSLQFFLGQQIIEGFGSALRPANRMQAFPFTKFIKMSVRPYTFYTQAALF